MICYTLGELIDRLSITHIKQWHLEEIMADKDVSLEEKGKIPDQIISLNNFRKELVEAINEYFDKVKEGK